MRHLVLSAVSAALLLLTAPRAHAQDSLSREEQARRHFSLGQQRYAEGRYPEALSEFELGYALSPRPDFLINFAQVYRRLGQHERALTECERYLATSPPADIAEQTRRLMSVIREEQARGSLRPRTPAPQPTPPQPTPPQPTPPQPTPRATGTPPTSTPPSTGTPPSVAPAVILQPPPPVTPPPHRSRAWIAGVVIGSLALAGAAVGIGVAVAYPTVTFPSEPLGQVSFK